MYYSKSTNGFYTREIHGDNIPADAVEITNDLHAALLEGQSQGKLVQADASGRPILVDPPPPTTEQIITARVAAVQAHMDAAARALNYDDIKTAVTYADEPAVPKFHSEGLAFREWRSLVWEKCYTILADVEAGNRVIPTDDELIAELPKINL